MARRYGPKPAVDESAWVPPSIAAARALVDALVGAGVTRHKARGIVAWLISPPASPTTAADRVQATTYRRELAKLGSPPWQGNKAKGA